MTPAELGLTKEEADLVQAWHAEEVARYERFIDDIEGSVDPDVLLLDGNRQYLGALRRGWQQSLFTCFTIRARLDAHRDAQEWARLSPQEQRRQIAEQEANFIASGYNAP